MAPRVPFSVAEAPNLLKDRFEAVYFFADDLLELRKLIEGEGGHGLTEVVGSSRLYLTTINESDVYEVDVDPSGPVRVRRARSQHMGRMPARCYETVGTAFAACVRERGDVWWQEPRALTERKANGLRVGLTYMRVGSMWTVDSKNYRWAKKFLLQHKAENAWVSEPISAWTGGEKDTWAQVYPDFERWLEPNIWWRGLDSKTRDLVKHAWLGGRYCADKRAASE